MNLLSCAIPVLLISYFIVQHIIQVIRVGSRNDTLIIFLCLFFLFNKVFWCLDLLFA